MLVRVCWLSLLLLAGQQAKQQGTVFLFHGQRQMTAQYPALGHHLFPGQGITETRLLHLRPIHTHPRLCQRGRSVKLMLCWKSSSFLAAVEMPSSAAVGGLPHSVRWSRRVQ